MSETQTENFVDKSNAMAMMRRIKLYVLAHSGGGGGGEEFTPANIAKFGDAFVTEDELDNVYVYIEEGDSFIERKITEFPPVTINRKKISCTDNGVVFSTDVENIKCDDVTFSNIDSKRKHIFITWEDPIGTTYGTYNIQNTWDKTVLVRKVGSAPENINDGDIVLENDVYNEYSINPFEDVVDDYDVEYFYRFFTCSISGEYTSGLSVSVTPYIPSFGTTSNELFYASPTNRLSIKYDDPDEIILGPDIDPVEFGGTIIVRNTSLPTGPTDGTVVSTSTIHNQYKDSPIIDTTFTPTANTTYYYGIFSYTSDGVYSNPRIFSVVNRTGINNPTVKAQPSWTSKQGIYLSWQNPTRNSSIPYPVNFEADTLDRVVLVRKEGGSAPSNISDGTIIYDEYNSNYDDIISLYDSDFSIGSTYTYKVFCFLRSGAGSNVAFSSINTAIAFSSATDAQIQMILDMYYEGTITDLSSIWTVGNTKQISVCAITKGSSIDSNYPSNAQSSTTLNVRIIGFNHDDLTESIGGKSKAGITFDISTYLPATEQITGSGYVNWANSPIRYWLNEKVKAALPDWLKNNIKTVEKEYLASYTDSTASKSNDDIFLFSENEMVGTRSYAKIIEGSQYALYKNGYSYYNKGQNMWTRSWSGNNQSRNVYKTTSQGSFSYSAMTTAYYITFGMCV